MSCSTIMIVGLGEIGGKALEILARRPNIGRIVAADVNADYGRKKVHNAIYGAQMEGFYPNVEFTEIDLQNIDETADILRKFSPSVIFNSTSLQSYWVIELLPKEIHRKFQEASYGPWLPMHLTLCHQLMKAVGESGIRAHVVNGAYPDAVNPVLGKIGLAPTAGIGNLELIIPQIRSLVSKKLGVPDRSVTPMLVMHHYAEYWVVREGHTGGAPYCLKIYVHGQDATPQIRADELFPEIIRSAARPGRPDAHYIVASSAVQKIMAIFANTNELCHVAGPAGKVGGYPTLINAEGARVVLPEGISMRDAEEINEKSQILEGIEAIRHDGAVVFTEKSSRLMKELLGYDCKVMKIDESQERAKELGKLYNAFIKKYPLG